ncbi:inorganic phosphate transporter [Devosia aquimaris]|uniref:inorganic phosphate transporter n=1 Tax=Devosia aquimaris TaxID=2866214 RepID=UPI001CD11242|nr:inorganic phosphate transporter [Devosia sp. CJK-A8-3]
MNKSVLDKDLQRVSGLETATHDLSRRLAAPGIALVFLLAVAVWAAFIITDGPMSYLVIIAAAIAGYMALNVGANDVANNMGPAVGSKALTMGGALVIAAIFEASGALLAGGDVVNTVARDLLIGEQLDGSTFVLVMMAALLASALWTNLATIIGAPVSTTHAVVGGVVGSGIAAAGLGSVAWPVVGTIAASWAISPVLGGIFAAILLNIIRHTITTRVDKISAARRWVPVLVALMTGVFAMYLATKGLSRVWKPGLPVVVTLGISMSIVGWIIAMPMVRHQSLHIENRKKHIAKLFRLPLIVAAALLSFAHGANDVANAIGPFAAIVLTVQTGHMEAAGIALPLWVLMIGAIGISLGLALFGPRLIRTVGEQITKLNEIRAYCVALSAAITVLAASALGLPVSSTHIAVGAIFGVGFLREYHSQRDLKQTAVPVHAKFVDPAMLNATPEAALAMERKRERRLLVRRQHVLGIVAAWVITVPASAALSAMLFAILRVLVR